MIPWPCFQDAKRPFANQQFGSPYGGAYPYYPYARPYHSDWLQPELLDPSFDLAVAEGEDREAVIERLKRQQEAKRAAFDEKMRYWESIRPKQDIYDEQLRVSQSVSQNTHYSKCVCLSTHKNGLSVCC